MLYCRPLIEDGRVYAALSPLYHVNKGTSKWQFYTDRDDFIKFVQNDFYSKHQLIHAAKKTPFSRSDLTSLVVNNSNYDTMLEKVADNYAIYPVLLEDLMLLRTSPFATLKKSLEKKYPYIKVSQEKGQVVIDGIVNDVSHLFAFNQNLVNACVAILPYLDRSEKRYLLDGQKVGLYELIKTYRQSEPKSIERAKGLGSLNAAEIGYSTLDPARRKLIRYTTQDIEAEIDEMRRVNDDQFQLIKDLDISQYEF